MFERSRFEEDIAHPKSRDTTRGASAAKSELNSQVNLGEKNRSLGAIDSVDSGPIFEDSFKNHISTETDP